MHVPHPPLADETRMRIFLIRHGETIWNAARIMQLPDTPLSERGLLQARAVAARLGTEPVAGVLSSDYQRARQTAEAVAEATGAPLAFSPLLRERNFGVHRGTPLDQMQVDVFAPDYEPPEGESLAVFRQRVAGAFAAMLEHAAPLAGDLVVVSHALVVRAVIERHLGLDERPVGDGPLRLPNTAVTVFDRAPPHGVQVLACGAHLQGDALPDTRVHPAGI